MECCERETAGCCEQLSDGWLATDAAESMAAGFAALGDPVRLRLLSFMAKAPDGVIAAGDLADYVCRSQPTVSHHLQVLFAAGLVRRAKQAKWVYYRIDHDRLDSLLDRSLLPTQGPDELKESAPTGTRVTRATTELRLRRCGLV